MSDQPAHVRRRVWEDFCYVGCVWDDDKKPASGDKEEASGDQPAAAEKKPASGGNGEEASGSQPAAAKNVCKVEEDAQVREDKISFGHRRRNDTGGYPFYNIEFPGVDMFRDDLLVDPPPKARPPRQRQPAAPAGQAASGHSGAASGASASGPASGGSGGQRPEIIFQ